MNQWILEELQAELAKNPGLDMHTRTMVLQIQAKRKYFPHPTAALLEKRRKPPTPKPRSFPAAYLKFISSPVVLSPLSDAARSLIFGDGGEDQDSLAEGLHRVLEQGEVLDVLHGRGGVLRCRDKSTIDIAIKIVPTSAMGSEYSTLQYLAEHAPDFPAPKPRGLIGLDNSVLILMSYIPSITLRDAWSTLSQTNKLSIQQQLEQILSRLREIKPRLGGSH